MEVSLIGISPAKFPVTGSDLCQLGIYKRYNKNNQMMIISSSVTNLQMGFGQIVKRCNLSLRVSAQSVSQTQIAVSSTSNYKDGVKLYVGLPMNSVSECNAINHSRAIAAGLKALKLLGVEGVELPIWWGVAEKESMGTYQWSGYLSLVNMIRDSGLKLHVSLCFHASKEENISLPNWVSEIAKNRPDIFFCDRSGEQYKDCLSFGVDNLPVFNGKTAAQVYQGFMESFKSVFAPFMGSTITGVTIGLGPDGELRYPSNHDHCRNRVGNGAGEFQCYDKNLLRNLKQHAEDFGNPNWGLSGPHDAPKFDQNPIVNTFFKEGGSWETAYGDFFLSWYSTQLISHADQILSLAAVSFSDTSVKVSGKLPLIHTWYRARSHPAELTSGFYNTINRNGYQEIAEIFSKNACRTVLPGMELLDGQQPNEPFSSPELVLADIRDACRSHGVEICGQNMNIPGSVKGFEQIKKNLANGIDLFLYQRMGSEFFSPQNFPLFSAFVRRLNQPELDSDDLGVDEREGVFEPAKNKNRTLQAV